MNNNFKKIMVLATGLFMLLTACNGNNNPTTEKVEPTTPAGELTTPELTTPDPTTPEPTTPELTTPEPTIPVLDNVDIDVRLEAEDGIIGGRPLEIQNGAGASNGKYAAGINDCGHGLYFIHYAPVGGEHEVEIAYFTEYPNSKHELKVNDVATTIIYEENTGWGFNGGLPGISTVTINLEQGYNIITLSKKGTDQDNPQYGGWAQVDYIEIKGTGAEFIKEELVYDLDEIKVQAELGYIHSGSVLPVPVSSASNEYIVGEINETGNGSDFTINIPESGTYNLKIAYGKDARVRPIDILVDEVLYTYSLEDYEGQSWDVFNVSAPAATLDLEAGTHTISISRAENSSWFCFDYFLLTKTN